MNDRIEKQKAFHEKRRDNAADAAFAFLKEEIAAACDKNNWDFHSLNYTCFCERGTDIEVENKTTEELLDKLIFWYDEQFLLPDCLYVNGKWT